MLALYLPVQDGPANPALRVCTVEQVFADIRHYTLHEYIRNPEDAVTLLEGQILADVEKDFSEIDFAEHPLVAARSSSGWSGEVHIGGNVVGYYQMRNS